MLIYRHNGIVIPTTYPSTTCSPKEPFEPTVLHSSPPGSEVIIGEPCLREAGRGTLTISIIAYLQKPEASNQRRKMYLYQLSYSSTRRQNYVNLPTADDSPVVQLLTFGCSLDLVWIQSRLSEADVMNGKFCET